MNWLQTILGVAVGAAASYLIVQPIAYDSGRSVGQSEIREELSRLRSDSISERGRVNEEIDNLSVSDLCVELGGVWDVETNTCS